MTVLERGSSGDVVGVLTGVLSVLTVLLGALFAVQLGTLSVLSSAVGIVLGLFAASWFVLRVGCYYLLTPAFDFALRSGASPNEALVEIRNQGRFSVRLDELHLMYVNGSNAIELPRNTEILNEYSVEQDYYTGEQDIYFEIGGHVLELGQGLEYGDDVQCMKVGWEAELSPTATTNFAVDMDAGNSGRAVIRFLWIRVLPSVYVSDLLPWFDLGFLDRLYQPIPLREVEEIVAPGTTPRVFGQPEYTRIDVDEVVIQWPAYPEAATAAEP